MQGVSQNVQDQHSHMHQLNQQCDQAIQEQQTAMLRFHHGSNAAWQQCQCSSSTRPR
jgi:hypothetical protein